MHQLHAWFSHLQSVQAETSGVLVNRTTLLEGCTEIWPATSTLAQLVS